MPRSKRALATGLGAALIASAFGVHARMIHIPRGPSRVSDFAMLDRPIGVGRAPREAAPAALAGSPIAALVDGALIVDEDSGALVRVDAAGAVVAQLAIGRDAAQLVVDERRAVAYVADRRGDRVVVVELDGGGLRERARFATPAEPYGIALAPDGDTLLVTAIADRALVALATDDGRELWRVDIGPDARGVAIRPDGARAAITYLSAGAIAEVELGGEQPRVRHRSIEPAPIPGVTAGDTGRAFARGAFAARYVGHDIAVVPHAISIPRQVDGVRESRGSYGGGGEQPPVAHRIAFVAGARRANAQLHLHQPRAMAYDAATDTLYLAGYGSDDVLALGDVSQPTVHKRWERPLATGDGDELGCGPTGLAVAGDGRVLAWCSLSRRVVAVTPAETVAVGESVTRSRYSAVELRGKSLFRRGNDVRLSVVGAMACTSCHPEGGTDGLSWRIDGATLQTPLLAGRVAGTHPYKWDGGDATLDVSLTNTVGRLGGAGLAPADAEALAAFLLTLDRPRAPTPRDPAAVARGRALFRSKELGCASCHGGARLTDNERYDFAADLERVDTPSLIGLASSAPYYHDGSAATLRAVLLENGTVHGMGKLAALDGRQVNDLIAYLMTL